MANTRVQLEVEGWVRDTWMREYFQQLFYPRKLKLSTGGFFAFDAVSDDGTIAACISTSAARTSTGNMGSGKLLKLRSDMLFLRLAEGLQNRLIILTDETMYAACQKEINGGRIPREIGLLLAAIPEEMQLRLAQARIIASSEVTRST